MLPYKHFTLEERKYLQKLLSEGKSMRKIAAILDRSPSSISREINRNRAKYPPHTKPDNPYWYNHWRAQTLAICRRRLHQRTAIHPDSPQWAFIVYGLNHYWSPETICGRWRKQHPQEKPICFSTVYRYIKEKRFPNIGVKTHLRRRGKRILPRKSNYSTIKPDRIIPQWPQEIMQRLRTGDWEGDTIYGGIGKGLLISMVDRKSRYLKLCLLRSRDAEETRIAIEQLLAEHPVKSISLDNGAEFADFKLLEAHLKAPVYFAEPHKPWQRGTNENTNDLVRFFYPKGYDFRKVTVEELQQVEDLINARPRKILDWQTPEEVYSSK